jgi:hypothetical protein
MNEPTPRQLAILGFWQTSRERRGYWPTMEEAAKDQGVCKVVIFDHVTALIRKGLMERCQLSRIRNVKLTEQGLAFLPGTPAAPPRRPRWPIAGTLSEKGITERRPA